MSEPKSLPIDAVFFDLDGTLADTAFDLADAANHLRLTQSLPPLPYAKLRPYTSQGTRGLIEASLGIRTNDPRFGQLRTQFLDFYAENLCIHSHLFPGIAELLDLIGKQQRHWGIVTNKPERFTLPLCQQLGLSEKSSCIISGDTCHRSKPAPDPLLYAAELLRVNPSHCIYVGDDLRDIDAGKAAGMFTIAVRYGYLGDQLPIEDWGADLIVDSTQQLADITLKSNITVPMTD